MKKNQLSATNVKKILHVVCTKLNKREYQHLLKNECEDFVCHLCSESSGSLQTELNLIKRELKKLDQLTAMHETKNFMSKQYDEILKGVDENKRKLEIIEKENKHLREEVKVLRSSIKYINNERVKK